MAEKYVTTRRLVRALRLAQGLTQAQVAERAGVDYKYYQRFEAGRTPDPSLKWIETLAEVFGSPIWILLCNDMRLVLSRTGLSLAALHAARKTGRPPKKDT